MEVFRPLRAVLFAYEMIRLLFLLFLGHFLQPPVSFPWPVYAVSGVLFPLMTLFLLIRLPDYKAYLPLYIAGKAAALAASLGWLFFSGNSIAASVFLDFGTVIVTLGAVAAFFLGDVLSAAGAFWLRSRLKETAEAADATTAAPAAADATTAASAATSADGEGGL
jgi:hypothetical protein